MIGAVLLLILAAKSMPTAPVVTRREACPGAVYFVIRGHHASWIKHKRLLCRIGAHDFYGDIPIKKEKK